MDAIGTGDIILLIALLLGTGLFAGVLAGLLGVGGGIVIVPVLYLVFEFIGVAPAHIMHLAVGTSLATIIVTAIRSTQSHWAKGAVDAPLLRAWAPAILVGSLLGSAAATWINGQALTMVFAVIAFAVALYMAFGRESWRIADGLPEGAPRYGLGGMLGFFSVMMGIGGGTLGVPLMSLFGVPIHRAVGTAAAIGLVIAIPGAAAFLWSGLGADGLPPLSIGYVNLMAFALIVAMTIFSAPWGAALAHRLSRRRLRVAFAIFLAITSARMFWKAIGG